MELVDLASVNTVELALNIRYFIAVRLSCFLRGKPALPSGLASGDSKCK